MLRGVRKGLGGGDGWRERKILEYGVKLSSSAIRVLHLRVGVRVGNMDWKKWRFCGGWFSASLVVAAQPLFLQEPEVEGTAKLCGGWERPASISAFCRKSALTSVRSFWSSIRIWFWEEVSGERVRQDHRGRGGGGGWSWQWLDDKSATCSSPVITWWGC